MRRRGPREWREFLTDETRYVVTGDRLEVLAARNDGNIGRSPPRSPSVTPCASSRRACGCAEAAA